MKFYFYPRNGKKRRMKMAEVREHLSEKQIAEAKTAKMEDPYEEVSYMADGGFIVCEF